MTTLKVTSLYHEPSKSYVEAHIVSLTPTLIEADLHRKWWQDKCLKAKFNPPPIDRSWRWDADVIDYEGRLIRCEKLGILAGDEGDLQGAMMITIEAVPCLGDSGKNGLFVERLFTAPRNRPNLRKDGGCFLKGVGLELLTWGASMSRGKGYEGRLKLDASPDFVWWYEQKAHLQRVQTEPMLFEGVKYTPMELSAAGAEKLLKLWENA